MFTIEESKRRVLRDVGLLWLRVTLGGLMLVNHGWGKLEKLLGAEPIQFADPIGLGQTPSLALAAGAEVVCAALLIVGLATRVVALPLVFTMLVAAFVVHGADPFAKKEFALLYAIPFFALVLTGPGRFSLDAWIAKRRASLSHTPRAH